MPERRHLDLARWKELLAQGAAPQDVIVTKAYATSIKAVAGDDRAVQIAISTEEVDRDSDTLSADGWELTNYQHNPVVLWAHQYGAPPIARATTVWVQDRELHAIDHFAEREVYPFADTIFQLVKGGYLNAASVGFLPISFERLDPNSQDEARADRGRMGGVDFTEQELLEHSIVPVPSNPGALVQARSVLPSADWRAYRRELERFLDEDDQRIPRRTVERAWESTRSSRSVMFEAAERKAARATPPVEPVDPTLDDLLADAGFAEDAGEASIEQLLADPALVAAVVGESVEAAVARAVDRAHGRLPP